MINSDKKKTTYVYIISSLKQNIIYLLLKIIKENLNYCHTGDSKMTKKEDKQQTKCA